MRYTQLQLRDVVGLSPEAIRHWRKIFPLLRDKVGRSPHFTSGDILALTVVRHLSEELGIPVGHIAGSIEKLVEGCNDTPWHSLENCAVVLDSDGFSFHILSKLEHFPRISVIVPLAPLMQRLRFLLVERQEGQLQPSFRFPPQAMTS